MSLHVTVFQEEDSDWSRAQKSIFVLTKSTAELVCEGLCPRLELSGLSWTLCHIQVLTRGLVFQPSTLSAFVIADYEALSAVFYTDSF